MPNTFTSSSVYSYVCPCIYYMYQNKRMYRHILHVGDGDQIVVQGKDYDYIRSYLIILVLSSVT